MVSINAGSDNPLLDRLQELVNETDFDFVVELIDIYLSETPKQIASIIAAIHAKNSAALTISAHTLKGSSLNLGARQLGALCLKLEELGRSGLPISPETNTNAIEDEFRKVTIELTDFKKSKN
jgi:HPt (histidine-containing phosphotransfer) domain-containing protein